MKLDKGSRFAGFELVHLLLLVAAAELAFNRLATPELRPDGDLPPPWWHQALDHIGLFAQYFASTLAAGIIAYHLWRVMTERTLYLRAARYPLAATGWIFLSFGVLALLTTLSMDMSFALETTFMAMALCLLFAQLRRGGDLGVKIGLVLLLTPLAVHYYGLFSMRYIAGEEGVWSGLPERVSQYGQWTLIVAALLSPYCFAPRPLLHSLVRPGPIVLATFISVLGIVLLRQYYIVAMRLAEGWLGVDIGPGAPMSSLFTYAFALGTMTWTLAACVSADSVARRDIGIGIGLIVLSGYGFSWPVQFLVSMVGLLTISESAAKVAGEEDGASGGRQHFLAPPIAGAVWRDYVRALAAAMAAPRHIAGADGTDHSAGADSRDGEGTVPAADSSGNSAGAKEERAKPAAAVIVNGDDHYHTLTHLSIERRGIPVAVRIERHNDSITTIEVTCGRPPGADEEPAWTLFARPERLLGVGAHPEPPHTTAPVLETADDPAFEHRFRVRDSDAYTSLLLSDTMRARVSALIDGWMAFWPEHGLRYRVHPGRGAPLDHPIPITEMAFRGSQAANNAHGLASVIDLLVDIAARGLHGRP